MKKLPKIITDGTLIGKYLSGSNEVSEAEVKSWLNEDPKNDDLYKDLQTEEKLADVLDELDCFNQEKAWGRFTSGRIFAVKNASMKWLKVAAVLVLTLGTSSVVLYHFMRREQTANTAGLSEIKAGEPKAHLELTNGEVVNLTELDQIQLKKLKSNVGFEVIGNTIIAGKKATSVKKDEEALTSYNTLVIPKGGEYKLILEDSTEVWLNADSKLKFPLTFGSNIRNVELTGEAYFKVKKDNHRPFIVRLNDMDVRVLGTEFNISSYQNDLFVTTTLVKGSVSIHSKNQTNASQQTLSPGDQASFNKKESSIHVEKVDITKFIAWKNGFFVFENQTLDGITRILERWYDVQFVVLNEDLKNTRFSGQFLRYDDIDVVLEIFRKTGTKIKFNYEGRIIKISH